MDEEWVENYSKNKEAVWIIIKKKDGSRLFLENVKKWREIIQANLINVIDIVSICLRFRSHEHFLDIPKDKVDGIYFCQSVIGDLSSTRQTLTYGVLAGSSMKKTFILVPDLIVDCTSEDDVSNCFEELILRNEKTKN